MSASSTPRTPAGGSKMNIGDLIGHDDWATKVSAPIVGSYTVQDQPEEVEAAAPVEETPVDEAAEEPETPVEEEVVPPADDLSTYPRFKEIDWPKFGPFKAFLANVDHRNRENDLYELLEHIGLPKEEVEDVHVPLSDGKSRGIAYVQVKDLYALQFVVVTLHGIQMDGRTLRCDVAHQKQNPRGGRGGRGGGRGGGGRGGGRRNDRDRDGDSSSRGPPRQESSRFAPDGGSSRNPSTRFGSQQSGGASEAPSKRFGDGAARFAASTGAGNWGPSRHQHGAGDAAPSSRGGGSRGGAWGSSGGAHGESGAPRGGSAPQEEEFRIESSADRPKLNLQKRTKPVPSSLEASVGDDRPSSIFGAARPREQVVKERGGDPDSVVAPKAKPERAAPAAAAGADAPDAEQQQQQQKGGWTNKSRKPRGEANSATDVAAKDGDFQTTRGGGRGRGRGGRSGNGRSGGDKTGDDTETDQREWRSRGGGARGRGRGRGGRGGRSERRTSQRSDGAGSGKNRADKDAEAAAAAAGSSPSGASDAPVSAEDKPKKRRGKNKRASAKPLDSAANRPNVVAANPFAALDSE